MEEWKEIDGFPDYMISSEGRICSMRRKHPVILKAGKTPLGYLLVGLVDENKVRHSKSVHRLVGSAFIQNIENKPEMNHMDGNKQNNCINNLEWVTHAKNMQHAFDIGLKSHAGVNNPGTQLTEEDVIEIYNLAFSNTLTLKEIGRIYGVSRAAVSSIKRGKSWVYLTKRANMTSYSW